MVPPIFLVHEKGQIYGRHTLFCIAGKEAKGKTAAGCVLAGLPCRDGD